AVVALSALSTFAVVVVLALFLEAVPLRVPGGVVLRPLGVALGVATALRAAVGADARDAHTEQLAREVVEHEIEVGIEHEGGREDVVLADARGADRDTEVARTRRAAAVQVDAVAEVDDSVLGEL